MAADGSTRRVGPGDPGDEFSRFREERLRATGRLDGKEEAPPKRSDAPAPARPAGGTHPAGGTDEMFFGTASWTRPRAEGAAAAPASRRPLPPRRPRTRPPPPPLPARPGQKRGLFLSEDLPGGAVALASAVLTIGRDAGNDIVLRHKGVSRRHAEVRCEADGSVVVADLQSANGTTVGGKAIEAPTALRDGDLLVVGPFDLRFRLVDDVARFLAEARERTDLEGTQAFDSVWGAARFGQELATARLIELCHVISLRALDGVLTLYGARPGKIELQGGQIVGAVAEGLTGEDAAWALLAQERAQVTFERSGAPLPRCPAVPTGAFLLELSEALAAQDAGAGP